MSKFDTVKQIIKVVIPRTTKSKKTKAYQKGWNDCVKETRVNAKMYLKMIKVVKT